MNISCACYYCEISFQLREFAKKKKKISSELCDQEKLGDSFFAIGESYHKLRKFEKSRKWYLRSWEIYESIGNLEVSWCLFYGIIQYMCSLVSLTKKLGKSFLN